VRIALAALFLAFCAAAWGQSAEVAHPDARVEERLKVLAEELRCLVCQNQTIADSNAPLALDLRNQIREQVAAGRSDSQIRVYMVERYGDFVLYRPPFKAATAMLWLGPFALLALGIAIGVARVRKRARVAQREAADGASREEIARLLE